MVSSDVAVLGALPYLNICETGALACGAANLPSCRLVQQFHIGADVDEYQVEERGGGQVTFDGYLGLACIPPSMQSEFQQVLLPKYI